MVAPSCARNLLMALWFFLGMLFQATKAVGGDCPLSLSMANFTMASSSCSKDDSVSRGRCCRYINEFVAVSVALYANETGNLGVTSEFANICIQSLIDTFESRGIPPKAASFCALGTKIRVNYECHNQRTVKQMLEFLTAEKAGEKCGVPLSLENNCRECKNASISRIRSLRSPQDNLTLGICRDAVFVTIASQLSDITNVASCFYGVQGIKIPTTVSQPPQVPFFSEAPTASPGISLLHITPRKQHGSYVLTLILIIGLVITSLSLVLLLPLVLLIRSKNRCLFASQAKSPVGGAEGASFVRKFRYEEIRVATSDFRVVIGEGGFGTVYKAKLQDGSVVAVKKMKNASVLAENEFHREIEFLAKLHHRHLVALLGFCVEEERFLVYEYLEKGSLKDHLHSQEKGPLSWETRIQIAIDVANALEYLHFYCNPPLCHRDVKSSNILLGENFVAKLADFGFARTSKLVPDSGGLETVDSGIWGTPGYIDPYYVATKELSEKSDVYSYGVLLLEMVTGKPAIHERKNLVESFQALTDADSRPHQIVDPAIASDVDQRHVGIVLRQVGLCTQRDARFRPSIRQVLRALWESKEPEPHTLPEERESLRAVDGEEGPGTGAVHTGEANSSSSGGWWAPLSSSTATSYCSRGVPLELGSPSSPYF